MGVKGRVDSTAVDDKTTGVGVGGMLGGTRGETKSTGDRPRSGRNGSLNI